VCSFKEEECKVTREAKFVSTLATRIIIIIERADSCDDF